MSGCIVGFYGYQRSGKTLLAYLLAESYRRQGVPVYTNMCAEGFVKLDRLSDLPLNNKPKILLLDEVYSFMDSRNWKSNTDTSLFFNTVGKQNILLLMTSIRPDMIEMRIREQQNFMFMSKDCGNTICYKVIDCIRETSQYYTLQKTDELFRSLKYKTLQVPDLLDCDMKDFSKRVKEYNRLNVG